MKFRIKRLPYYISVILKLWREMDPRYRWTEMFSWFKKNKLIHFKEINIALKFDKLADLLEIKEALLDDEYHSGEFGSGVKAVIDIGAGVGDFSVLTAKKFPQATVIAYEPDPARYALLCENGSLNSLRNLKPIKKYINNLSEVLIPVAGRADVLKLDCEGGEFPIILASRPRELMRFNKITMEYHLSRERQLKDLVCKLEKCGFQVRYAPNPEVNHLGHLTAVRAR